MLDTLTPSLQRTRGFAAVTVGHSGLERLAQSGSAKAFLPRTHAATPEVVFLNTAGGLTGGDRLSFDMHVGAGARVTATTQTAERAYRSPGGAAQMTVTLSAGAGAQLHWLPQETILFDGAALHRRTEVDLAPDAEFLFCETLVLGRLAMGEVVARLDLLDRRAIRRGGMPVLIEPLALDSAHLARRSAAGLGGARAMATVGLLAADAGDRLPLVRRITEAAEIPAHATAWDGKLILRAMAPDPRPLRRLVADVITALRNGPLPRVWQV